MLKHLVTDSRNFPTLKGKDLFTIIFHGRFFKVVLTPMIHAIQHGGVFRVEVAIVVWEDVFGQGSDTVADHAHICFFGMKSNVAFIWVGRHDGVENFVLGVSVANDPIVLAKIGKRWHDHAAALHDAIYVGTSFFAKHGICANLRIRWMGARTIVVSTKKNYTKLPLI